MGGSCQGEEKPFRKIEQYTPPINDMFSYIKAEPKHSRYGNIEKIRTKKDDIYKLIMATNDAEMQTVSIECRILSSVADFQMYDGTKFDLLDKSISPIIDIFNRDENQIYHPIKIISQTNLIMKVYSFSSFRDNILKKGIYQIWLYNQARSLSPLYDYFIMSKGQINALVMIFKRYETSLLEIVRYRQLAQNYHWSKVEIVSLWRMLINNYKQLNNCMIYHRDIRLGKIFFSPNTNQPFQFVNLETARKINKSGFDNDLLTVIGIDILAEQPMKQKIKKGQDLALYDPFHYDILCLIKVLLSVLKLDPLQSVNDDCNDPQLASIIRKLRQQSPNLIEIERQLDTILRNSKFNKQELFAVDKIISEHLSKSQLRRIYRQQIDQTYLNTLLLLHKKQIFNPLLINKMQENNHIDKKQDNVGILHKVGGYYERIGINNNQYYKEELRLLLDLSKQCREEYFYPDHKQYLKKVSELIQYNINKEEGQINVLYHNELVYQYIYSKQLDSANKQLSILLNLSYKDQDLPVNTQIDILMTKAYVQILNHKYDTSELTIQNISLALNNKSLENQYYSKMYQGKLEYLKGYQNLEYMNNNKSQIKAKTISATQTSLNGALQIFLNLPESPDNTIRIIETYLLRSDMNLLREQFIQCKKSIESADILVKQMEKQRPVSNFLKLKIMQRLKIAYQSLDITKEPFYNQIINQINKLSLPHQASNAVFHQRTKNSKQNSHKKQGELNFSQIIQQLYEDQQH